MRLTDPWTLGGLPIPNRVVLAPLAGIGNWFVRLQARRYGAGLVVSEMVSSHAVYHSNHRTLTELLRIHPDERHGGPVSIQLFGQDPDVMRRAAEVVAGRGADLIDLNMGCPVPKVMKTGAGAALLKDPETAVAVAKAAQEGSGLPVTVKLRAEGVEVARRLVHDAGVAGITFHPRTVKVRHKGTPDYDLAGRLVQELPVPVIVSGGMQGAEHIRWVFEHTGCAAGEEVVAEWLWVCERAVEHLGEQRAAGYLRKFHPWYVDRLKAGKPVQDALQRAATVAEQAAVISALEPVLSSAAA